MRQRINQRKYSRLMKPVNSLINMNTLPTERRRTLQNEHIGKQKSTFLIKLAKEVVETWENHIYLIYTYCALRIVRCHTYIIIRLS